MKSIVNFYGLKVFSPNEEMQISASAKTHIDYLFSKYETNGNEICFHSFYKADKFASLVVKFQVWKDRAENCLYLKQN